MFFDALQKTPRGAVVCVFDITDRLQHMFFRHLDRTHPANRGRDVTKHAQAIKKLYQEMKQKQVNIGGIGDHGGSIGVYFFDPDGNEIEVSYERPKESWPADDDLFSGKFGQSLA